MPVNPAKPDGYTANLPGMGIPGQDYIEGGYVETELGKQISRQQAAGEVDDRHAGIVALAVVAARNVDNMGYVGRPSGRANMLRAAREVFEMLPEPETGQADDAFRGIVDSLTAAPADEELEGLDGLL